MKVSQPRAGPSGRRYAHGDTLRARHADPGLRAELVAAARRQGAGDLRHARSLRDPLLPAAERPHRPARGTRVRPRPGQAAPAPAVPAEPHARGGAGGRGGQVTEAAGGGRTRAGGGRTPADGGRTPTDGASGTPLNAPYLTHTSAGAPTRIGPRTGR